MENFFKTSGQEIDKMGEVQVIKNIEGIFYIETFVH